MKEAPRPAFNMNKTEAWETVWQAAANFYAEHPRAQILVISQNDEPDRSHDLMKALTKTGAKVVAMRRRLDSLRATLKQRKKTASGMPPWLEKATR